MLLEQLRGRKEQKQEELFAEVVDWLRAQAEAQGVTIKITEDQIEERQGDYYTHILVPVRIVDDLEAYDQAKLMSRLERPWNEGDPRPKKLLFLYPAGVPRDAI